MNKQELKDYIEANMSYLCLYNLEGELIDAFLNMKFTNNLYVEQHQKILDSGSTNTVMTFRDIADGCVVGALYPHMVAKTNLVIYSPEDMLENHPEFFLEDE